MTRCEVLSSIHVGGEMVRRGEVSLPNEDAERFSALGYVRIISRDGETVLYAACCDDAGAV